jgi:hypothetical protein
VPSTTLEVDMGAHASAVSLDHLFAGGLPVGAARAVVSHLLECATCRAQARVRMRAKPGEDRGALPLPVALERHFGGPRPIRPRPAEVELAEQVLAATEEPKTSGDAAALVADRRSAALAGLASARRRSGDLDGAAGALREARAALALGSGEAEARARLLELEGRLHLDLGEPEAAERKLLLAAAIHRRRGERRRQGQMLVLLARAAGHRDPQRGAIFARRALGLIDPRQEPRLALAARHALAWFLNDGGSSREARDLLESTRPLYRHLEDAPPTLHRRWLEARVHSGLRDLDGAEQLYRQVWREFRAAGFNQDLTLVTLDLAALFVLQGRPRRASLLLTLFAATLCRFKMHPDGLAAWRLLRCAVHGGRERALWHLRSGALYIRETWLRPRPFLP